MSAHEVSMILLGTVIGVVLAIPIIVVANLIIFRIFIWKLNKENDNDH